MSVGADTGTNIKKPGYRRNMNLSVKQEFYEQKFKMTPRDFPMFKQQIKQAYVEALCWTYAYYYKGCISWNWFYPYHYAPFPSDLTRLENMQIQITLGKPFRPIDQLLSVLPSQSAFALPACLRPLMSDISSEIIDFYPVDFEVDVEGKRWAWMGQVILPFINEERLLRAIEKKFHLMNADDLRRNKQGETYIFFNKEGYTGQFVSQKLAQCKES